MNLYQKIIEIRKTIEAFSKDTHGFGYNYVSGTQVLAKIKPKMDELGIILKVETENIIWQTFDYRTAKDEEKTDFIISGDVIYTWINADNPEEREATKFNIFGQQDDISKAFGSGLTYSERYFILKTLQAPTDSDDPDSKDTKGKKGNSKNINPGAGGKCEVCGVGVTQNIAAFSNKKFNKTLCMQCQKTVGGK